LIVRFGGINTSLEGSDTFYSVTPYVYWDRSGALVLDYAVQPSVAEVGGVPTWWEERYGQLPDLAFNLPWRNEAAKTGTTVSELKRTESKNIVVNPRNANPGDEVWITALVQNYSLLPSSDPVPVRFYAGDPANGGVPITGTELNPDPMIEPLAARGSGTVRAPWTVPDTDGGSFIRVYAVIDPDNTIQEIHKDNNKGWGLLLTGTATSIEDEDLNESQLPASVSLHQNYPNPFNPATTIRFELPDREQVRLEVFDILGRRVALLVDEEMTAGSHQVRFDASRLSSGVYLYRLHTGSAMLTRKMTLIK